MGEARCAAGEHQLFGEAAAADASGAVYVPSGYD